MREEANSTPNALLDDRPICPNSADSEQPNVLRWYLGPADTAVFEGGYAVLEDKVRYRGRDKTDRMTPE